MADAIGAAAGLGVLAWYLSALYVGWRLLRVAARRDDGPARWIGTYLFVAMGIGSILISIPTARGALGGMAMTPLDRMLVAAALACTVIGNLGILTFTRRVFRAQSDVARAFAVTVGVLLACGAIGHGFVDRFSWKLTEVSAVLYLSGTVLSNGWSALESLRYYGLMRKRVRVGLADPLAANRFLLWGIGAGATALMLFATMLELQLEAGWTPERLAAVRAYSLPVMSLLGLTSAGSYLFAFLPAGWYVRRFAAAPSGR
jgi:hypothetical protein